MRNLLSCLLIVFTGSMTVQAAELTALEELGKRIFFDRNLSNPPGQSCASCHNPEAGFSGPEPGQQDRGAIMHGAVRSLAGNRKPPSAAYASYSPVTSYDDIDDTYVGGLFWDGRALNLAEQAKAPFLNPVEMNNANAAEVVTKVLRSDYRYLFDRVYGLEIRKVDVDTLFDKIAKAIAAYESSSEVNSFSSKYDAYLAGRVSLTPQEQRGLELFVNKANCAACHPNDPDSHGNPPLFTDFTYDNVGAPRNPQNPYYRMPAKVNPEGARYRDLGIGGVLKQPDHWGKVKVPTLRNVAKKPSPDFPKAYLHNGVFKTLKEVVHFYNKRNVSPHEFGAPDVFENVNKEELGDLGMTDAEENDLIAFLETLSDGYFDPNSPPPGKTVPGPVAGSGNHSSTHDDGFRGAEEVSRILRFRQHRLNFAEKSEKTVR